MSQAPNIDGVLLKWGDRLLYPGIRVVNVKLQPRLGGDAARTRPAAIHRRIEATVVRRAPQVMVKVTDGGRGTKATLQLSDGRSCFGARRGLRQSG